MHSAYLLLFWPVPGLFPTLQKSCSPPPGNHSHRRGPVCGVIEVLLTSKYQRFSSGVQSPLLESAAFAPKPHLADHSNLATGWSTSPIEPALLSETVLPKPADPDLQPSPRTHPQEIDPLYLFACHLAWEQREEPSAAWDLLAAARVRTVIRVLMPEPCLPVPAISRRPVKAPRRVEPLDESELRRWRQT